ncbi:MAG: (Fe-S)-binding protein [Actinomycetota bacterium]
MKESTKFLLVVPSMCNRLYQCWPMKLGIMKAEGTTPTRVLFRQDLCDHCGRCLTLCPVLRFDAGRARESVRLLASGQWVADVLDRCTGCMSCDALCPTGAGPYGLLLEHYHRRYQESGIPGVFRNAMPQREGPDLWNQLERWLTPRERANLDRWSRPPAGREVLFLGCNQRLTPFIADTPLFDGLEIFCDSDNCCGEYFLRLGLIEEARARAEALSARFRQCGIERVIAFCPACENTMTNLAPRLLGVDFDLEVTGLVQWLSAHVDSGDIALTRRLRGAATVQDPCHASGLDSSVTGEVRSLVRAVGLEVWEMVTSGATAECCGLGAALSRYSMTDVVKVGIRRARQAAFTGADITCAWCNGCYMVMNMTAALHPLAPPVYHLLELVGLAAGEHPVRSIRTRRLQIFAAALEATARDGFRFSRVRV